MKNLYLMGATYCAPCKQYERVLTENNVNFMKVNLDEDINDNKFDPSTKDVVKPLLSFIKSVPTLVLASSDGNYEVFGQSVNINSVISRMKMETSS